jgi:ribosomal-protein-alanine N-acetyltransferase
MKWTPGSSTHPQLTLGVASTNDVARLRDIEVLSQPSAWSEQVMAHELEVPQSNFWVARRDDEIVGFLVFWVVYDEVHILNVAVHPEARRLGVARELLQRLMERAEAEKMTSVTLEVRVSNEAAQKLYEGFGFQQIGRRKAYYADNGEDAFVLAALIEDGR